MCIYGLYFQFVDLKLTGLLHRGGGYTVSDKCILTTIITVDSKIVPNINILVLFLLEIDSSSPVHIYNRRK